MTATADHLVPAGYYKGKLLSAVFTAPEGKSPAMAIEFDLETCKRTVFLYLSDNAWPYTEEKLRRLGFNGNFEAPEFTATECELACKHEEYEGKMKEKWDVAGGFKAEPAPPDVAKQFGAKWRASTGAPPAKPAGKPSAPPPARSATPPAASKGPPPAASKPTEKPYGKDEAWDDHCKLYPPEGNEEQWRADITKVCAHFKLADETQFGEMQWRHVGGIPF